MLEIKLDYVNATETVHASAQHEMIVSRQHLDPLGEVLREGALL